MTPCSRTNQIGLCLICFFIVTALNVCAQKSNELNEKDILKNARHLVQEHKFVEAGRYLLRFEQSAADWSYESQAEYHLLKGVIHFELYQFSEALIYLAQAKRIAEVHTLSASLHGKILLYIGKNHKEGFTNSSLAREFYNLALAHFTRVKDNASIAATHFQFARSYSFTEVDKREYHNMQALAFYEQHRTQYAQELAECYNLEAIRLSYVKGVGRETFSMYEKAIQIIERNPSNTFVLGKYYDNLGYHYSQVDPVKGLKYLQKGLSINKAIPDNDYWVASSYNNIAAFYTVLNNHDSARFYLQKVVPLMIRLYDPDHPEVSNAYSHIANSYASIDKDAALMYYRKALLITSETDSINAVLSKKIKLAFNYSSTVYAFLAKDQSEILWKKYQETKNVKFLFTALHNLNVMHESILEKLLNMDWENSRVNYLKDLKDFHHQYIRLLHEAYLIRPSEAYAIKALNVMEDIRYVSVMERKREALLYKTRSSDRIGNNKLLSARGNYIYYKTLMNEALRLGKHDNAYAIRNEFLEASRQYFSLLDNRDTLTHKKDFPKASSFLRNLRDSEALIEYYEASDSYYTLMLTRGGLFFSKIDDAGKLNQLVTRYEKHFSNPPPPHAFGDSLLSFIQNSHALYRALIGPFETVLSKIQYLTIIPDGSLYRLPFETLVRTNKIASFKELDYLMHSLVMTRALSFTQVSSIVDTPRQNKKIAAFASALLPSAETEIKSIEKYFEVTTASDTKCSVNSFNQLLPEHNLIHLAVHGESDLTNPLKSRLIFNNQAGDTLYAYQLYSYDLSGKSFVLSACNSSVGIVQRGEGVFSISRAFFYAGADEIIVTLWNVADRETSILMNLYYQKLAENKSSGKALQLAKSDYLKNADGFTSHPIYWAGLVMEGPMSTKEDGSLRTILFLVLALVIVSAVGFYVLCKISLQKIYQ